MIHLYFSRKNKPTLLNILDIIKFVMPMLGESSPKYTRIKV